MKQDVAHQEKVFLESEADQWFQRNKKALIAPEKIQNDSISYAIRETGIKFGDVLEVGCANGWRLNHLRLQTGARCSGVEPSRSAVQDGMERYKELELTVGTISKLPYADQVFDLLVINFVFHWVARETLLSALGEVDRVLKPEGHLIVADFHPDFPCKRDYHHAPEQKIFTYKQDYCSIFLATQMYQKLFQREFNHDLVGKLGVERADAGDHRSRASVSVLKKMGIKGYRDCSDF